MAKLENYIMQERFSFTVSPTAFMRNVQLKQTRHSADDLNFSTKNLSLFCLFFLL